MSGPMRRALFVLLVLQSGCPETDRESLLDQSWIDAAWPDGAAIEPDAFDLDAFDALDADRDAPSVDAPSLDGSSIDTPSIDAPSVDAALGPEIGVDRWSAGLIPGTPLRDELLALALEWDCLISIDTDAHAPGQLEFLNYGCDKAARHGIEADRIINTWPIDELLAWTRAHPAA